MVRKTNFLSISVLVSEIVTFMSKKKSSLWIAPKVLKKTERHSLEVCGTLFGEKQFLLIFIPFYWFDQKKCLNKSKFYSGFSPFKHGKKNNLFEYFSAGYWDSQFYIQKEKFSMNPPKMLQNNRKHSLAVCGSLCGEKRFLLMFIPFNWFDQKKLFKQIQNILSICPFQTRCENFFYEYFSAR